MSRKSWIDPETNELRIDGYAKKLKTFTRAFADGVISEQEISDQQARLIDLMKDIEPAIDDATHTRITKMITELTAFNIMQLVFELQQQRIEAARSGRQA